MLTDRGKIVLAAGVGLWLVSRALGVDAFAMAATGCLAVTALAIAYTRLSSARLATRRAIRPVRLFHDGTGRVDLDVTNDGRVRTATLVVEDEVPAPLGDAPSLVSDPIRPGETVRLSYTVHGSRRGHYRIGPAQLLLRDPFGIAQRAIQFGHTDEIVVYPPMLVLPPSLPRTGRFGSTSDGTHRPPSPQGEFANVREYVRGDDLKKVHWKTTARRGKLMVTQDESPREAQATLVLDTRIRAHSGSGDGSTFETAVTAAASAAYHLDQRGYTLRLLTGPFVRAPQARGWRLVLDELAAVQMTGGHGSLAPLWAQLKSGVGGDGLLLAIVTNPDAEELRAMVRTGRSFVSRAAVVVTPRSVVRDQEPLVVLRNSGWRAITVHPGTPLPEAWNGFAARPATVAGGVR
jgi:uncharacterized protein (DUF58 family)